MTTTRSQTLTRFHHKLMIKMGQPTNGPSAAAAVIDYLLDDSSDEKLRDIFEFYDADGDGKIQREELIDVLAICANDIGLEVDAYLEQIAEALFSNAQLTPCGSISFEALKGVLRSRPNLINELSLTKKLDNKQDTNDKSFNTSDISYLKSPRRNNFRRTRHSTDDYDDRYCFGSTRCSNLANFIAFRWENLVTFLGRYIPICNKLKWEYISNNLVRFNFFLAIFITLIVLFIARIFTYWGSCSFLILARASGQCLNFLCAIIVLLVCRRSISLLRSHGYGRYLPLDDHVYFHKMIGIFIGVHTITHTIGHLFNFLLESMKLPAYEGEVRPTWGEYLFSVHLGIGWIGGCASLTGWILIVILIIMSLAQPFSRSVGKFELFYYTHLLYIPFWTLLFIHAPRFWYWFIIPFTVFLIESLIRLRNFLTNLTASGQTTILKAVPLPSNVIHLTIKKPPNFEYNPGDWIYVLVPQIAKYEWHPFTISSAPEQEGVISLHIRAVGEWTRSLRSYFEGLEHRNHLSRFIRSGQFSMSIEGLNQTFEVDASDSAQILGSNKVRDKIQQLKTNNTLAPIPENNSIELLKGQNSSSLSDVSLNTTTSSQNSQTQLIRHMPNLTIFIDGPYGSPSSQIFRAEHAVLIATGIGVTPFASILQSIVNHYEKRRQKCPKCLHEFCDTRPPFVCKLKKVDFLWINRDQKSFEWFIKLLAELELTQSHLSPSERFLDIHIHLTAIEPAKTKSIGLQLALYLVHEKNKKDLVTGLRTRTKAGRPNWDEFFDRIEEQKRGKVSVFFCGRPQLGRLLHRRCDSFGFKFRKEIF